MDTLNEVGDYVASFFGDAVKGLHVYDAMVVRPQALACLIANRA